jgi:radical SAM superfamily enzyme YgiQ (UPF0313 family)
VETIYLCHLTHTSQVVSSEYTPQAIGCIKSHYMAFSGQQDDVRLFVYPEKLAKAIHQERPSVVAFSNFMWNRNLSVTFAAAIKKAWPETLIIFGGPNFPLETHQQENWLRQHPMVDFYIGGEGEQPFLETMKVWRERRSVEEVRRANINGTYALVDGKMRKTVGMLKDGFDDTPRILELDDTPSPYLMGYLDEFLFDPALVPIMECNRGCPFACTFCVDGISARTKVKKLKLPRLEAEIEYIAQRYTGKNLMIADTNFGMYPDDLDFCKILARAREKYKYPENIIASTGKNRKELILQCAEILGGALRIAASVQSMDEEVLHNIKRSNISYDALVTLSKRASGTESNTFSEMILALPGDSKVRHAETIRKLVDSGLNQIRMHTCMMLEGSELGTDRERAKWNLTTRYRVMPRCFGVYEFGDQKLRTVEIEEVCVQSESLPFKDFVECRRLALTVTIFYNDRVFFEIAQLVQHLGWKVSDWLLFTHANLPHQLEGLRKVYEDFTAQTIGELWESREALERHAKEDEDVIESYVRGDEGINVLLTNQARIYRDHIDELNEAAFYCTRLFLRTNGASEAIVEGEYLRQLERYSLWKKKGLMDLNTIYDIAFDYDFPALEGESFPSIPEENTPTTVRFAYQPQQKELLGDQLSRYGNSLPSWGKILSRVPIKKMQRRAIALRETTVV